MKYLLLIPDGMADREVKILGDKTPLEVADKPNIDYLTKYGMTGITKTIPEGFEPGSDIANLTILGVDVEKYYTGRGPIEAIARDLKAELVFRCNLVYVRDGIMVDYSGRRVDDFEAKKIISHLNDTKKHDFVKFYSGRSYRNLLLINKMFEDVGKLKTTPPHDIQGKRIEEYLPRDGEIARLLNELMEWSKSVMVEVTQKPNMIWLWGGGRMPKFPKFSDRTGKKGAMISEVDLLQGIGKGLGMRVVDVEGITGYIDTNYKGLCKAVLRELRKNDFVVLHTEGIDEVSHEGDAEKKVEAISIYDEKVVGYLIDRIDFEEVKIMLLPDHPTPVDLKTHTAEFVPFLVHGGRRDDVKRFDEKSCSKGGFGFVNGLKLLELFLYYRGL